MVRAPIIIQASIIASIAIAIQAGLDFLGLGDLTIPTWGNMLNDGFNNMYRDPQLVLSQAIAIALTCIALILFANALRDELERSSRPRRRRRRTVSTVSTSTADQHCRDQHCRARYRGLRCRRAGNAPSPVRSRTPGPAPCCASRASPSDTRATDGSVTHVVQDVSLDIRPG